MSPRFTWQIAATTDGARQVAYRLDIEQVGAGTETSSAAVASSGRVESSDSVSVELPTFVGVPGSDYRWTVTVWLGHDQDPVVAQSTFGIAEQEWRAPWVEPPQRRVLAEGPRTIPEVFGGWQPDAAMADRLHPPRHLRQSFTLQEQPRRARLRITSQGINQSSLNGTPVSDGVFEPGYESYQHEISVVTHDVTHLLRRGENVLGVVLGDGWYAGRISMLGRSAQYGDILRATWELSLAYADGREERIVPDESVRSSRGPIDWSDLFIGERYDARRSIPGWDAAGYDHSGWEPCALVAVDVPLHPFIGEPIRRVLEFPVREVLTTPAGDTVLDVGQVIAGRMRLSVSGEAGTVIRLEHTETLDAGGNWFVNIVGVNKEQTDEYVLSGAPEGEEWEPFFTFHGFRYVRITGYPGEIRPEQFTAVVLANDLELTADLTTSDPRLDQLVRNTVWSQRGNFLAVPMDCPQRERAGWTGDVQIFAPTAATLMNVAAFLERWLRNVRLDQSRFGGIVPDIVPLPPAIELEHGPEVPPRASAGWGDVITLAPWALYEHYGDDRFLSDNVDAMRAWIDVQTQQARDFLPPRLRGVEIPDDQRRRHEVLWNGVENYGDWLAPSTVRDAEDPIAALGIAPALTGELVGPAFQALSLDHAARAAAVLGYDDTADEYRIRLDQVRHAFAAEYVGSDGRIGPDLQGVYVLALAAGLVPEERRSAVVENLVRLVREAGDHLDTGFVSVGYLLDVLWENGHKDVARTLLVQDTPPSWLYEVRMGATTIWESWEAIGEDGTPTQSSLNHYAFGCVVDWIMRRQAGIQLLEPGYRRVLIAPDLSGPLESCAAHIDTPYGRLAVTWRTSHGEAEIDVVVPVGVEADLALLHGWETEETAAPLSSGRHRLTARAVSHDRL